MTVREYRGLGTAMMLLAWGLQGWDPWLDDWKLGVAAGFGAAIFGFARQLGFPLTQGPADEGGE